MSDDMKALSLHLATLKPLPSGWLPLDRDKAAAALGVGRVKLARILAKAEKSMGIQVESDRVKVLTDAEIYQNRPKPDVSAIIAFATEFMRRIEEEKSQ